ncbi:prepilin-type N-terminal cleavage/methylation domain-containing protein [Patescibacteria group bacterium]|nr:prepilin-type N-terminal cleavage/methylation domain-containing protein [Patescibacteria group bacterium]
MAFKTNKGFTLIELILVIALIAIMAAVAVPTVSSFSNRAQLDSTTDELRSALRLAQQRAMAVNQDSAFGVYFDDGNKKFYIFRGANYGDFPAENVEFSYSGSLTISQSFVGNEVDFDKLYGTTSDTGTISINSSIGLSESIDVSALGKIERN